MTDSLAAGLPECEQSRQASVLDRRGDRTMKGEGVLKGWPGEREAEKSLWAHVSHPSLHATSLSACPARPEDNRMPSWSMWLRLASDFATVQQVREKPARHGTVGDTQCSFSELASSTSGCNLQRAQRPAKNQSHLMLNGGSPVPSQTLGRTAHGSGLYLTTPFIQKSKI